MANREIKTTLKLEGEQQYKKAMTDAANSIKVLNSEQKLAAAQFEATGNKEQYLADKTDILKRKIAEQQKAVKAAQEAVTKLKEKGVDPTNKAMQTWQTKLNTSKAYLTTLQSQLNATESELSQQEQAFDNAGQAAIDYGEQLHGIGGGINFQNTISSLDSIQGKLNAALDVVKRTIQGVWDAEKEAGMWADNIITEASRAQLDVETYQSWQYAANFIDTQVDDIISSQDRLLKAMSSDNEDIAKTFNRLGVNTKDEYGNLRDTNTVFWEIIEALGQVEDAYGETLTITDKNQIAQDLFGRGFRDLVPLITAGKDEWDKYVQEGRAFATVSEENVRKLGQLDDSRLQFESRMEATKNTFLAEISPAFTSVLDSMSRMLDAFNEWLDSEEGQAAMGELSAAIQELLESFTTDDFEGIVKGAAEALKKLKEVLRWIADNSGTVAKAIAAISGAVVGIEVSKTVLEMLALMKAIKWTSMAKGAGELATAVGAGGAGKAVAAGGALPWLKQTATNVKNWAGKTATAAGAALKTALTKTLTGITQWGGPAAIGAMYAATLTAPVWGTYAAERRDFGSYLDERKKTEETIRLAGDKKLIEMQELYAKFVQMAEKGEALNEQDVESIIAARAEIEKITGKSYSSAMDEITEYFNSGIHDASTEYEWEMALGQMIADLGEAIRTGSASIGTDMAAGIDANAHVAIERAKGLAQEIASILTASYNLGSYVGVGGSGYGGYGRPTYAPYSGMINANIVMDKTVVGRMTAPAVSGTIAAEVRAAGGRP